MPIYEYISKDEGCQECEAGFEISQKMSDPPLEECPCCGQACERIFSTFSVGGKGKTLLNPKNLEAHGFTQYTKKGKGYYEKTAGKGPMGISDGG